MTITITTIATITDGTVNTTIVENERDEEHARELKHGHVQHFNKAHYKVFHQLQIFEKFRCRINTLSIDYYNKIEQRDVKYGRL